MKYCLRCLVLILALSASVVLRADTDAEVSARKDALELAGAFGNDGFKIRDGHSCGVLKAHDHVPMVFVRDDGVRRQNSEHIRIESGKKYFINAGSVGQPRDGNWRAGYCIYDIENNLVELLRVKYDLATAQKKITKAGLPRLLAERLAMGR